MFKYLVYVQGIIGDKFRKVCQIIFMNLLANLIYTTVRDIFINLSIILSYDTV